MSNPRLLRFTYLEVTGFCNERCGHCYADSSPKGTHGSMSVAEWVAAIDQLGDLGVVDVQFIGGEPTLYPNLPKLIRHAHARGLNIEVFSNMTHIKDGLWDTLRECGAKLATSYYSDDAAEHDAVTRLRGSHKRTRANIEKAVEFGIPIRGGVVAVHPGHRALEAITDLAALGVGHVGADRMRAFGRASEGTMPDVADLCGHCARGQCAIGPDGDVWPCVLGRFITLGNLRNASLEEIWNGPRTTQARAEISAAHGGQVAESCTPPQFLPMCEPCGPCVPSVGHCDPREVGNGAPTMRPPV
ncbi:radical SAM protein [Streptomyces acidiscabies]|uniref:Radical SAM protein n=1 Tax=Streptomyces acidiscabies TaxID=42234 RepID=A0AAP6BJU7_9ACTN|nr:radical SAM protein [Streptomyces acidiscabies]MBP5938665.1 radical SAM protein [Streptomyces sp. LBUM 1476]MBZ3909768.1 radical SAM protein [Streptomyces acidiscabies]MDX2965797.1 radical SAM protein [Streptomyces acidiscabies]MDX3025241.1 radical SAM protein [Streptomyces acidiscabies]MDX3795633.1 radical SAM protein [Streptomyces acidiscabies]